MKKRILSTLLVLCIVLGVLPKTAQAQESYSYQQEGATFYFSNPYKDYGTITLSDGAYTYVSKLLSVPSGTTISVSGRVWHTGYVLDVPDYADPIITFKNILTGNSLPLELEDTYVYRIYANMMMLSYNAGGFCVFTEGNKDITRAPEELVSGIPVNDKATSGLCGAHSARPYWALDLSGNLSIKGLGAISDFSNLLPPPWYENRTKVRSVEILMDVTDIGSYAFWECGMARVTIGGGEAERLSSIHSSAFYLCDNLTDIYYPGTKKAWNDISIKGEPGQLILANQVTVHCSDGEIILDKLEYTPHTHSYDAVITPPTCTKPGYTTYTCECGDTYQGNEVAAIGHNYSDWVVMQEATEEKPGLRIRECSTCNYKETESIPWTNPNDHTHTYTSIVTPPTCTEKGYTVYTCECGDTYRDEIPATGHSYGPWRVVREATEKRTGLEERSCETCGDIQSVIIPKLNSEPSKPEKPAEKPIEPEPPAEPETPAQPETPTQPERPVFPVPVYNDVASDAWYSEAAAYVASKGLMAGTSEGNFSPNEQMTRAMVWTVLGRMAGADVDGSGNEWYAKAQAWAAASGVSDGANPNGGVTRQELAVMLWRSAGSPEGTAEMSAFSDGGEVAEWAGAAMRWAVANGVLNGDNGALKPGAPASRAEVAAMLMRFCEKMGL